jgi:hypothetical protein
MAERPKKKEMEKTPGKKKTPLKVKELEITDIKPRVVARKELKKTVISIRRKI